MHITASRLQETYTCFQDYSAIAKVRMGVGWNMIQALPEEIQYFKNLVGEVFNRRRRIIGTNWSSSELQKLFVETMEPTQREQAVK